MPLVRVREDPPFGPAAAIMAGLDAWTDDPDWVLVLACDLPRAGDAVSQLMRDIVLQPSDIDGLCLADANSRPQWLTGLYRTTALRQGATSLPGGGRDASIRALLDDLAIAVTSAPDDLVADVDTWEDLNDARLRFAAQNREESP